MAPQLITEQDRENYGDELINMSQRAAVEALTPELQQLRAENQHLRGMAQRSQRADIERALNQQIPAWREIYGDPRFAQWLSLPDDYSGGIRSQLLRRCQRRHRPRDCVLQRVPAGGGPPTPRWPPASGSARARPASRSGRGSRSVRRMRNGASAAFLIRSGPKSNKRS